MSSEPAPDSQPPLEERLTPRRAFEHEGESWVAEVSGVGVAGTGRFAWVGMQLLRFTRSGHDQPERETLMALRDPDDLHDPELVELLRASKPVAPAGPGPDPRPDEQDPSDFEGGPGEWG